MQSIRTTTSNWSFQMWICKFCPILALWQPFWIFGGHFELFCSLFLCYDIKFKYSWLPTCANKTGSKNYNFKLVFYSALSKNIAIFGPFGGHFDFFGGHLGFLLVCQVLTLQIGIPACSLHAKNRESVRTTASNLSFRVCIGEFSPLLSSVAAVLNFLAAILDFYWFVMY